MGSSIALIVAMLVTNGLIYDSGKHCGKRRNCSQRPDKAAVRGSECRSLDLNDLLSINVTQEVQNLTSPNYPNEYTENLDCYWQLRVPSGQTMHLYLQDFNVVCNTDYLLINKGPFTGSLYEGCWKNGTQSFINATRNTGVRFFSNNVANGRGFLLLFSSNKDALQTHITNIDNSPEGGSGGSVGPNANSTGSTNGTLGSNNFAVGIYHNAGGFPIVFSIGFLCLCILSYCY